MVDMKKVRFFTQTSVSIAVMGFCMGLLIRGEKTEIYLPVLTGIVGYWLPQPSAKNSVETPQDLSKNSTLSNIQNSEKNIERIERIEGNIFQV